MFAGRQLLTLDETNSLIDDHDYVSTRSNFADEGVDCTEPCFTPEAIRVTDVDPFQLIDDPDDHEGLAKRDVLRSVLVEGAVLPPVYVLHDDTAQHPYWLFEGRHRYNASAAEDAAGGRELLAWVGHLRCTCVLPSSDNLSAGPL